MQCSPLATVFGGEDGRHLFMNAPRISTISFGLLALPDWFLTVTMHSDGSVTSSARGLSAATPRGVLCSCAGPCAKVAAPPANAPQVPSWGRPRPLAKVPKVPMPGEPRTNRTGAA